MVKDRSKDFPDRPEIRRYNFGYGADSQNNNTTSSQSLQHHPSATPSNGTTVANYQSQHTTQQPINYSNQPYNYSQTQTLPHSFLAVQSLAKSNTENF